jgi:hypothetical protein
MRAEAVPVTIAPAGWQVNLTKQPDVSNEKKGIFTAEDTEFHGGHPKKGTRERVERLKAAWWEPQKMPRRGIDALRA